VDRRTFLFAAAAGVATVACSGGGSSDQSSRSTTTAPRGSPSSAPTTTPPRATFVKSGPSAHNRVALTFHTNGDLGLAQQLLDIFTARGVVVTCFVVGNWLEANPTWAVKLTDAGHELANHTYTHPSFLSLSAEGMRDEIIRCRDVLTRLAGSPGAFFRPSGTDDGTASPPDVVLDMAGEAGYRTVLGFDLDTLDYRDPGPDVIVRRTADAVRAGSIVSMHFGHPGTIAAMPAILDGLRQKNLTPVHASQLLSSS
jgi:peptidoglycan/xylan/chitin deacetylase (PgdA/CDA1 family)